MAEDLSNAVAEGSSQSRLRSKTLENPPEKTKGKKLQKDVLEAVLEKFPKAKLKDVRVHSGGNAKEIAKSMSARSFTVGNDIFFAKPGDVNDKKLLAHELARIVQTGKGRVPKAEAGKALVGKK